MSGKKARITRKTSIAPFRKHLKPALPRRLFWEFRYDEMDWHKSYVTVIERVMQWGIEEEWLEVIRFYGRKKVIHTLKYESTYLPEHTLSKVCEYFKLKKEDMRCYIRTLSRGGHWNS